jgi:hypothetical protein
MEERDKNIIWKTKGIAGKASYRLFSKYGHPKYVDEKFEAFAKKFNTAFAVPLLESHLKIVLRRKTNYVGSKALNYAIKFCSQSTKLETTMQMLLPFVE